MPKLPLPSVSKMLTIQKSLLPNLSFPFSASAMKKKKLGGKLGAIAEKVEIPVETDPYKLVNYVCGSNIMQTGEDIKVIRLFVKV